MTSYLHYNQAEMHFCAEDLLIAWQCQSVHEDIEADCVWQAFGRSLREDQCSSRSSQAEGKGNNPFCTLSNNYSNMKIITVEAMQLYHETNMSYTVIQFMLPVKIITHSDETEWRRRSCNCVLKTPGFRMYARYILLHQTNAMCLRIQQKLLLCTLITF